MVASTIQLKVDDHWQTIKPMAWRNLRASLAVTEEAVLSPDVKGASAS